MFKKIISYVKNLYRPVPDYTSPHGILYKRILNSSYKRRFYEKIMVPDTLDGRFDLIILHIFIIIKIFKNPSEQNKNFTQKLFDIFMTSIINISNNFCVKFLFCSLEFLKIFIIIKM